MEVLWCTVWNSWLWHICWTTACLQPSLKRHIGDFVFFWNSRLSKIVGSFSTACIQIFFCSYLEFWCQGCKKMDPARLNLTWQKHTCMIYHRIKLDKSNALTSRFVSRVLRPSVLPSDPISYDNVGGFGVLRVSRDGDLSTMIYIRGSALFCFPSTSYVKLKLNILLKITAPQNRITNQKIRSRGKLVYLLLW